MRKLLTLFCLAGLAALCQQTGDPFVGRWKWNLEKSTTTLKDKGIQPKSVIVTYERQGEIMKVTTEVIDPDGKARAAEHIVRYDGKFYPRYKGAAPGDEMMSRHIDDRPGREGRNRLVLREAVA